MQKFNPFDRVLIRPTANHVWSADFYDRCDKLYNNHIAISGATVEDTDILPYTEETKHLHNTVGEFTVWEPKKGEPILVKDDGDTHWTLRIFVEMCNRHFATTTEPETSCYSALWDQAKPYTNPFKE